MICLLCPDLTVSFIFKQFFSNDCKLIPYNLYFSLHKMLQTSVEFGADYYVSLYLDAKQFITAIMNLQALFALSYKKYMRPF